MKKEKLVVLESLRGVAAISVAFFHFNTGSIFNNGFTNNAWLMVDFFFVLSGFVIAFNYLENISSWSKLINFQKKRFFRLYPLHFIMLIVFLIIEIAKYLVETNFELVANNPAFSKNNFISFFANLLLIQNWILSSLTFNQPSWSISSEFFIYTLFALTVFIFKNKKNLIFVFLLINILIFGFLINHYGIAAEGFRGNIRCIYSFSIGAVIYYLYFILREKFLLSSSIISIFLIFFSVFIVSNNGDKNSNFIELVPVLFGITILSIVLTSKSTLVYNLLSFKWLVYLGTISYGIYMIHDALWWIFKQVLKFIFKYPVEVGPHGIRVILINDPILSNLISFIGILLVILFAHFSYHLIEKRFYKKN